MGLFDLSQIAAYRENNRLEAKSAQGGLPRSLWETYSAFANTQGGVILLGAEETPDRRLNIIGVADAAKLLDDFWNTVNNEQKVSVNTLLDENMMRVDDTPAHQALREAIANCLCNANYYERRGVVCVWGDREITISNPGDFRMEIEEARRPGVSDPRNGAILRMFSLIDIGERAGSGMSKLYAGWESADLAEPYFETRFDPDRTTLVLPLYERKEEAIVGEQINDGVNDGVNKVFGLTKTETRALEASIVNQRITAESLACQIDVSKRTAERVFASLKKKGVIERVGSDKDGFWKVIRAKSAE